MPTNNERAAWAQIALEAFSNEVGDEVLNDLAADLICDLGHLCQREGFNFLRIVEHGVGMYAAEKDNPDPAANCVAHVTIE